MQLDSELQKKFEIIVEHHFIEDTADYLVSEMPELLLRPDIDMTRIEKFSQLMITQLKQAGITTKGSMRFLCIVNAQLGVGFQKDMRYKSLQTLGSKYEKNKVLDVDEMKTELQRLRKLWQPILGPTSVGKILDAYRTKTLSSSISDLYSLLDKPLDMISDQIVNFDQIVNTEIQAVRPQNIEESRSNVSLNSLGVVVYKILRHDFGMPCNGHLSGNFHRLEVESALYETKYNDFLIDKLQAWS
jgi:hypothetical protein